ncbi:hypothetical protein ACT9ST_08995 [Sphingobium limneticum]|uniref:hypothetical protein n=1 Tax=Sphingobium limneticum TaxID=1007511 RepID=UPI00123D46B6|nr:hypothetical protein [Sphingobium limneticum]
MAQSGTALSSPQLALQLRPQRHFRRANHLPMGHAVGHDLHPWLAGLRSVAFVPDLARDQINLFVRGLMLFRQASNEQPMKGISGIRANSVHGGILSMASIFIDFRRGGCLIRRHASMKQGRKAVLLHAIMP